MANILDRHHNGRFLDLMDTVMPQWPPYREKMNRTPLVHEGWRYWFNRGLSLLQLFL